MYESRSGESFTLGVILGALAGAAAGLLLAPASGAETREVVKIQGRKVGRQIKKRAGEMMEDMEPYIDEISECWEDVADTAENVVGDVKEHIDEVAEQGSKELNKRVKRPVKKLFSR